MKEHECKCLGMIGKCTGCIANGKKERRAVRHELQQQARHAISLNARLCMTPAQIKQAARVMTDQAIATVTNAR